ncbi:MAG: glycosyltransferase family 4 protein [Actinobacteria bacterium]|nr:glycosyltransferase family 4 protein [Actinomycetota bacterium]
MRVLWLTNDLPPRAGGIQQFVANLLARVHPEGTLVVGPGQHGAAAYDTSVPWRTVRAPGRVLPTPAIAGLVREVAASHRPDVLVLGAAWPLGELAGTLGRDLDVPVVALSHGLEAGLADVRLGVLLRRATRDLAALTTISDFTEERLRPHVRAERVVRVPPGVDVDLFHPGVDGAPLRSRWGVPADAPLVGCISRLVRRKGQDTLLDAWATVQREHADAWLVLAGEGPLEDELRSRAAGLPQVVVPGRIPWQDLPAAYAALDLFAMPCRTRLAGTDVEGLGIVYLEAQACGVPAVAGRSGGAPEAVRDGRTGAVVDGTDAGDVARTVSRLLTDPAGRAAKGDAGRAWVEERWSWTVIADRFRALLEDVVR